MSVQAIPLPGAVSSTRIVPAYMPQVDTSNAPVFVATSSHRRWAVAAAGWVLALLASAWLAAFAIGAAGFGSVPPLPSAGLPQHGHAVTVVVARKPRRAG